jgi:hypothetical protein
MVAELPYEPNCLSIDEVRRNINKFVEDNAATEDRGRPLPGHGYRFYACTRLEITPGNIGFSAQVGGRFEPDTISFEVGSSLLPSDLGLVTYPLFHSVLLTIVRIWRPIWANAFALRKGAYAKSKGYGEAPLTPGIPPHPINPYHVPWQSYLSAPLAAGLDVPAEILSERTPDGGLLLVATEERFDPTNPEQMRRSRTIAGIMVDRAGGIPPQGPPPDPAAVAFIIRRLMGK